VDAVRDVPEVHGGCRAHRAGDPFHRLDEKHTRVTLQLEHEPEGVVEKAGDALGIVQRRVKGDLEHFKEFIESRGREEGGWRGEVGRSPQSRPTPGDMPRNLPG
jgi:hypothetical protein